jgi:hypothetical protein
MEAVRQAMNVLGYEASPAAIQQHIKDNFGVEMNTNMISSYKSTIREKAGMASQRRKKKRGRPRKVATAASAAAAPAPAHDAVPWRDIRTIKDLAARLGKKGLRDLVELLE